MQALLGAGAPTSHVQPINRQHVALDFALDVPPLHMGARFQTRQAGAKGAQELRQSPWARAGSHGSRNNPMDACRRAYDVGLEAHLLRQPAALHPPGVEEQRPAVERPAVGTTGSAKFLLLKEHAGLCCFMATHARPVCTMRRPPASTPSICGKLHTHLSGTKQPSSSSSPASSPSPSPTALRRTGEFKTQHAASAAQA